MRTRDEIRDERRQLLRANRYLRDDVHAAAGEMIANTTASIETQLVMNPTVFLTRETPSRRTDHGTALLDLAALWALTRPEFVKAIHAAIDEAPAPEPGHEWSPLTRSELDRRVAALDEELAQVEREARRQPLLEQRAELDAELQAIDAD